MINMDKWKQIAAAKVNDRPTAPGRLCGKIAVVTGSAQGFGLGIAKILYAEGAAVVIADMNAALAEKVAADLGERAIAVEVNVTDEDSVAAMIGATVERFGGLDLFVNNAGVVRSGPLSELEKRDFDFVTNVNYTAYFLCAKYASEIMKAEHDADPAWTGDIVEINSKSGLEGSKKNFAYAGSKFGGLGLTQSFALELCEYNIKVNAICPGNYLDGPLWTDPERGLFRAVSSRGQGPGREDRRRRARVL